MQYSAIIWTILFALLLMPLPGEIVGQSCMFCGAGVSLRRFVFLRGYYGKERCKGLLQQNCPTMGR